MMNQEAKDWILVFLLACSISFGVGGIILACIYLLGEVL